MSQACIVVRDQLAAILDGQQPGDSFQSDDPVVMDIQKQITRLAAQMKENERILREYACIDALTGVTNRRAGLEILKKQIEACSGRIPLTVCFLDLDYLKEVNDRFGHNEGDRFIRRVSRALMLRLRDTDTVARIGGDEFLVIMPGADEANARLRMEEVLLYLQPTEILTRSDVLSQMKLDDIANAAQLTGSGNSLSAPQYRTIIGSDQPCPVARSADATTPVYAYSFSYGVKTAQPNESINPDEMIQQADRLMYEQKQKRRIQKQHDFK